jgi:hypothetical protein
VLPTVSNPAVLELEDEAARVFGRCEEKSDIAPFDHLVASLMKREPYRSARRVFWIVDNGPSHAQPESPGNNTSPNL